MLDLITQGEPILLAHDDAYLGPKLRMGLALADIGVGRYETARALFQAIIKDTASSDLTPRAKEFVGLTKKAGLVP